MNGRTRDADGRDVHRGSGRGGEGKTGPVRDFLLLQIKLFFPATSQSPFTALRPPGTPLYGHLWPPRLAVSKFISLNSPGLPLSTIFLLIYLCSESVWVHSLEQIWLSATIKMPLFNGLAPKLMLLPLNSRKFQKLGDTSRFLVDLFIMLNIKQKLVIWFKFCLVFCNVMLLNAIQAGSFRFTFNIFKLKRVAFWEFPWQQ